MVGKSIVKNVPRLTPVHCIVGYIIYLVLRKLLHSLQEARRTCQIMLRILFGLNLAPFSNCSVDLTCFANSLGSDSSRCNVQMMPADVYLLAVVSKSKTGTAKEVLKNSALDSASGSIGVYADRTETGMDCVGVKVSIATSWGDVSSGIEWRKTMQAGKKSSERGTARNEDAK